MVYMGETKEIEFKSKVSKKYRGYYINVLKVVEHAVARWHKKWILVKITLLKDWKIKLFFNLRKNGFQPSLAVYMGQETC